MTDEEFDALRERVQGHTPGPLFAGQESGFDGLYEVTNIASDMSACTASFCKEADAHLYAAAPDLLAYAERLRDENAALRTLVEGAYYEGLDCGYHVTEVPCPEDWERSKARAELERINHEADRRMETARP